MTNKQRIIHEIECLKRDELPIEPSEWVKGYFDALTDIEFVLRKLA